MRSTLYQHFIGPVGAGRSPVEHTRKGSWRVRERTHSCLSPGAGPIPPWCDESSVRPQPTGEGPADKAAGSGQTAFRRDAMKRTRTRIHDFLRIRRKTGEVNQGLQRVIKPYELVFWFMTDL